MYMYIMILPSLIELCVITLRLQEDHDKMKQLDNTNSSVRFTLDQAKQVIIEKRVEWKKEEKGDRWNERERGSGRELLLFEYCI